MNQYNESDEFNESKHTIYEYFENADKNEFEDIDDFNDVLYEYHDGNLLRGVNGYGFEKPSDIQSQTLNPICSGRDLIAQAQSGSGKTGAFVIGSLTKVNIKQGSPQVIILSNTKELAHQTYNVASEIGCFIEGLKLSLCVGKFNDTKTNMKEARKSHLLIGTPGRMNDLITHQKNKEITSNLKLIILDEADSLLRDDFINQIRAIVSELPKTCQICLFSATYTNYSFRIASKFLLNPIYILVENDKLSVDKIKNYYIDVNEEQYKYDVLLELYNKISICQAVIFVNSVNKAEELTDRLRKDGHTVGLTHSKLSDDARRQTLKSFRKHEVRILIATDMISRGIDVQQVGLVINYDVPNNPETYIHRVGRSGRFGKSGVSITFITNEYKNFRDRGRNKRVCIDHERIKMIEDKYDIKFEDLPSLEYIEI